MHLLLRDQQLKIITYIQIVIYKPHGNHKPQIYNTYTHKKEFKCDTKDSHQNHKGREKRRKKKELQKQPPKKLTKW